MPIQGTITLNHLYTSQSKSQAMPTMDEEGDVLPECYAEQDEIEATRH
tara:strand:- start:322 stop:465 length:144 start_codon:yes stop_codon:yes gene_type:complete